MTKLKNADKEEYICHSYQNRTKSTTELQKELRISPNDIYEILKKNNIELRGNKLSKEKSALVCALYAEGLSAEQIKEKTLISEQCIRKQLKLNKIPIRKEAGRFKRIYELDETIFEQIDSHEKAQLLGLIYSDGNLSSFNKAISVRLREDDLEYLEQFRVKLLKTNKPIYFCKHDVMTNPQTGKKYKIKYRTAILDICSSKIYNDLLEYGLCSRKTWENLPMPNIPNEYKMSFLLGYFEGDGCVTFCKKSRSVSFACQKQMSEDICDFLRENGIFSSIYFRKYVYIVSVCRIADIKKLYNLFYEGSSIFMKRKKQKYEKLVN